MNKNYRMNDEKTMYYGLFRALVTEVNIQIEKEVNDFGAIKVFVPDIHSASGENDDGEEDIDLSKISDIKSLEGIIAFPGNSPLGAYNTEDKNKDSYCLATCYVPAVGSWVFIQFEGGDITRPVYLTNVGTSNSMVPGENRGVDDCSKVYTILKTGEGRSIVVADSSDVARVVITGKKRLLKKDKPEGDNASIYKIDGNQTVILINEIAGQEQVLIKTHKGDFLNFDIEKRSLEGQFEGDIILKTNSKFTLEAADSIEIKSGPGGTSMYSAGSTSIRSLMNTFIGCLSLQLKASLLSATDAGVVFLQSALACFGKSAAPKTPSAGTGAGGN